MPLLPEGSALKPHSGDMLDVVFLGSIYGRKRPGDLAKAVAMLSQQHMVRCTFIGDTNHMNTLGADEAQLMRTHPAITLSGPMERNAALQRVAQADVLVLSSADESQPLVPLEAAALKVPVVLSRLPMYPYSGWVDGDNCLMHEAGDVNGLAQALLKLHVDRALRQRLGEAGHVLAQQFALPLFLERMTAELVGM
jgi:glycosyltransferase involved in cell wall biosynthesis